MNQIVVDAETVKKIQAADGPSQLVTESGTLVAVVNPVKFPHSPFPREEIERRLEEARKNRGQGKTLAEVWAAIHNKYGENP